MKIMNSVICTGDKKSKRGNGVIESPIRHFCEKYDVPYTQLPRFEYFCECIINMKKSLYERMESS